MLRPATVCENADATASMRWWFAYREYSFCNPVTEGDRLTRPRPCSARLFPMPLPIRDRIAKLREEIAQISEANSQYVQDGKKPPSAPDHERRLQRLEEIRDELISLTDWKKT
jgi:hypothetical protein